MGEAAAGAGSYDHDAPVALRQLRTLGRDRLMALKYRSSLAIERSVTHCRFGSGKSGFYRPVRSPAAAGLNGQCWDIPPFSRSRATSSGWPSALLRSRCAGRLT